MKTKIQIKKTYGYYGYPQAERHYEFKTNYMSGYVYYYGNQGWDYPMINAHKKVNGYFWDMHNFMEDFYSKNSIIQKEMSNLRTNEEKIIVIGQD